MTEELILEHDEYFEHHRFVVDLGQAPMRVDKFLDNRIQNVSRNKIQTAVKGDCVLVNGKVVKNNYKVKPADVITVVFPEPPQDFEAKGENIPINIAYEDDEIIIVNKPAGMVVHPAYANYTGTLVNALLFHFSNLYKTAELSLRPGLVHRIDKDTSGILVVAKSEYAMTFLARQFFDHSIDRVYHALVWGNIADDQGTIDKKLNRDSRDRRRVIVVSEDENGKNAVTHYKVLERFNFVTLIECRLETGRTHQIRAHMKSIGHPLFSDSTYGGSEIVTGPHFSKYKQFIENCFQILPRQALHAKSLGFIHPSDNKYISFDSELPDDFNAVLAKWRKYSV